jgi:hypothetical protein
MQEGAGFGQLGLAQRVAVPAARPEWRADLIDLFASVEI